jgi:hypothetical protein
MEAMENRKKPKYKIGDKVVIKMFGTYGKITDIKWIDGKYLYEIENNEGFYYESKLELLSEYDGEVFEKEHIDIEYRFFFGDLVQVKGYGADLFKVVGFRTEIWRYKENAWEDIIYELSRLRDGEWLEAGEEELTLVADAESADTFIQKMGLLLPNKPQTNLNLPEPKNLMRKAEREELNKKMEKKEYIDFLLDVYNDYRILYNMFQDPEYEKVMQVVLRKLSSIVNGDEINRVN